jgi:hypothetical protein
MDEPKPDRAERQQIIDWMVNETTALYGDNRDPASELTSDPDYFDWMILRARSYRAWLEAMADDALRAEGLRCYQAKMERDARYREAVAVAEEQERQQEAERLRTYHQHIARRGGLVSAKQHHIIEACCDIRTRFPHIRARHAHRTLLNEGHTMPDGRVIRYKKPITLPTFRRYWAKAGSKMRQ